MENPAIKYRQADIEQVFQKLISGWSELTDYYNSQSKSYGDTLEDRLAYVDVGNISRFIVDKIQAGQTDNFEQFFENVEDIMIHGDHYVQELIVIGLFEGIQNNGGQEINYYHAFDQWLKDNSLKAWKAFIDFWEGNGWRSSTEENEI